MGNACSCCSNAISLPQAEVVNHLDETISFIEMRLDAIFIDKPQEGTSVSVATTIPAGVASSVEYGSCFLQNVVRRVRKHTCKIVKTNHDIQKVVIDMLKEANQFQWVGAGLGVVACVLDQLQMDKISTNAWNECVDILCFMCGVAKHIKRRIDHLVSEKLNDLVVFIVKGSIFCISRMQSTNVPSSYSALVDEEEIKSLPSQLINNYPELGHDEDDKQRAFDLPLLSGLDELMSYIEKCLAKTIATDKAEENTSPVASSIKYGSDLLRDVLKRCKRYAFKIMSGETRKVVIDVMKEASQIHWVAAGLSVVAYVLQKVDDASTNKEECVQVLEHMCHLATHIKRLDKQIPQEKLHDVAEFIFKGSFYCVSRIQSSNLSRIFSSVVDVGEIRMLRLELGQKYQDLTLEALTEALHRMPKSLPLSQGQKNPDAVGIDESVKDVTKLLGMDDEKDASIRAVVVYGVGGMGKTTLANAVFSSLDLKAYKYCHLIIKQDCSEDDLQNLQKQILSDLFGQNSKLRDSEEGHQEISRVFRETARQPLFLFIDNALKKDDLAKILPDDLSKMPKRSRMLVTTRKLDETDMLADQPDIITRREFPINSLPDEEAKKLLSKKAFDSPFGTFHASSDIDGLLGACGGIPLVLNLVGTRLRKHRNDLSNLNSTIESFKDSLGKGESELTQKVVDVVYDSLPGDRYKDAFLDIAGFFSSWKRHIVSYIVGNDELVALEDAALVKSSDDKVELHDVVLKRGRKLAGSDYRITDSQSLADIIEDTQRLEKVKGICFPYISYREPKFQLQAEHLDKMHKCLKVLFLGNRIKVNGTCSRIFENLRYLTVDEDCSPMELKKLPRLSFFEGRLRSDDRLCDLPHSLRCLKLYSFRELTSLPNTFGQLSNLRELWISHCPELSSLSDTFGQLSNLEQLTLSSCRELSSLSDDFGQLKSLLDLTIVDCRSLERLSDTLGQLSNLRELWISNCPSLSSLSDDFGQLKSLEYLNIVDCSSLERLSDIFGQLSNLRELWISHCSSLSSLSDDFGSLASVKTIEASYCPLLEGKVVDKMIELKSLMALDIRGSQQMINRWNKIKDGHPQCVGTGRRGMVFKSHAGPSKKDSKKFLCWKALGSADKFFDKSLDIDGLLRICGGNPSVLEMIASKLRKHGNDVRACESTIEFFKGTLAKGKGDLSKKVVDMVYNTLQENMYKDAFLDIAAFFYNWGERTVGYIVDEVALKAIEEAALVQISEAGRVIAYDIVQAQGRKLSKADRITNPQSLHSALQDTQRLEKLKGILLPVKYLKYEPEFQLSAEHLDKTHKCLRVLILGKGTKVTGACTEKFENLRYLKINNGYCSPMELNKLPRLAIFEGRIRSDDSFCDLPHSLRRLKVDALQSLRLDESFGKLSRLEELDISQNEHYMTRLPQSFGQLKSLRCLKLSSFRELTSLPDTFGQLSNLEELNLSDCTNLSSLSNNFGKLGNLKRLKIINCTNLLNLPDGIGQLNKLKKLVITNCTNLGSLCDSLGQLSNLKKLVIVNCTKLAGLCSRFGQLKSLKYLRIRGCRSLQRLSDDFGSLTCVAAIEASGCPALEAKEMDRVIQLESLMVLNICESQLMIKRWEEIKEGHPLTVRTETNRYNALRHSMSRALFDRQSRFLNADGVVREWSSTFLAGEEKIALLVTCCDLCSSANEKACQMVKEKIEKLSSGRFNHIMYVGLMEQSEGTIRQTLRQLSQGIEGGDSLSLCAWIPPHYKWKQLFGFSACMALTYMKSGIFSSSPWRVHTFIAEAQIPSSEQGNPQVEYFERIFPKDEYVDLGMYVDEDEDEDEEEVEDVDFTEDVDEDKDEDNKDEDEKEDGNGDSDDEDEDEDEEGAMTDLGGGFSTLYPHLQKTFILSTL